jgi:ArsR family transcriptional regulator, cadmium/lead-responsive transcriptional repressor
MAVSASVDLDTLGRVGKALADPTRRQVLVHLTGGPGYPAEMAEEFGATRANLSNHLTCLRECGLVTATAEGRRIRYELADSRLANALRILAALDLPGSCQLRPEVAPMARSQLSLNVSDLDAAVAFYTRLLGTPPATLRP